MSSISWHDRLDKSAILLSSARLCAQRKEYSNAKKVMEEALLYLQEATESDADPIPVVKILHELGMLAQEQEHFDEAEARYLQALDICEQKLGPMAIGTANRLTHLAWLYRQQNQINKSLDYLTRILNIYLDRLGTVNKPVALILTALAILSKRHGEDALAEECREELRQMEPLIYSTSREIVSSLRLSVEDSSRRRKQTIEMKRLGIIPGDTNDFPQIDFVFGSLLGGKGDRESEWEEKVKAECIHILETLDEFLKSKGEKKAALIDSYEENPDGSSIISYGSLSNKSGLAIVRLRISIIPGGQLICQALDATQIPAGDGTSTTAARVPEHLQQELFRGARVAFMDLSLETGTGIRFEFMEAHVSPMDAQAAAYRNAGWTAIANWSKSRSISIKENSRSKLWQLPPIL